jgi:hypothetical protein
MTARRHHYHPQCYLKGFTQNRNKPKLFVTDVVEKKTFYAHPRKIAAERDFNRVDVPGQAPDAVGQGMSKFEGELAPALERIIASRSIDNTEDRV